MEENKNFSAENQNTIHPKNNLKVTCGVLGILLGYLGIHKFVLGYTKEGIIQLVAFFLTCGISGIIGFIEGIIYLTKSDEEFYRTYQQEKRPWF
ncbi:TM2 domain-containing membrane protein YozV [Leeuwenhoekiella aestuarii]|uniref:TM2 domain-containing membrane protein YozV n=1 Tax=Leeuwenhoekiella aestuarii TaxID=2249426 RepID=A0A4Q0NUT7_9FLAO|nr:TM2 domain-containing protein [Leeuwenhoekiella aestuarii]RXG14311.1 TM2 domain-containing membrane protein YozV [Leeuwenhoekiella aestuarii]RXG19060.1 TM2 domain-containing membrane protein YozV [Leeuwenhoekiella aestuarii]